MSELPDRRAGWIDNLTRHWAQDDEPATNRSERHDLLPILQRMTARIRSDAPLDDLLTYLATLICEAIDCEIALLHVFDPDRMKLSLLGIHGVPPHLLGDLPGEQTSASEQFAELRPGALITFTPYRPLVLQHGSEVISAEFQELQGLGAMHILVVPLFHHGHLLGRLDLLRTRDEPMNVEVGALANILGTLVAGAIYGVNEDDSGERFT